MFFRKPKEYVWLDKRKDYLFCYKKKRVIEDNECDYHEYNQECERNKDYIHMTHSKGSMSGWNYVDEHNPLLNECKHCLKQNIVKYRLSHEAVKCMKEERS